MSSSNYIKNVAIIGVSRDEHECLPYEVFTDIS